jgi:ADP-ribose pyrophosphatase YjhB (NUDIX family)
MKLLSEKAVYSGKIFSVVQQEVQIGDQIKVFEMARRAPWTRLIIVNDKGQILLSKEYRKETNNYDTRLPGGKVFDTLSEYESFLQSWKDIQQAAKKWAIKEAQEEVGIVPNNIEFFATSINGATVEWDLYYFVVRNYTQTVQDLEHGEDISFSFYDPELVNKMCLDGTIQEDRSAMVLMRFLHTA